MQLFVAILLISFAKGVAGQLSFCAQSSSPLPVATMCKPTSIFGNHVVIDVTEAGERMVDGINVCTCYLTPVITKEKARLYVLKQSSLEPGYNGCGSRIDVIIDSTQESGMNRNVCFLNGNVELKNNTVGNISFVKEFYPNDDRYCIGLRSDDSSARLQVQCFAPGEETSFLTSLAPVSTTKETVESIRTSTKEIYNLPTQSATNIAQNLKTTLSVTMAEKIPTEMSTQSSTTASPEPTSTFPSEAASPNPITPLTTSLPGTTQTTAFFTTEITTKSIGTLGKETQSSQKQPSTTIGHIPKTTPVTNKEQLDTGSENAAIIATSVILPVIFFVLLVLALMIFLRRKRRNSSQNISKQKYIPSVDKLVQESAKENRDILNVCHSKKDSIYDTIEDEEGYLKSFPVRKICNLPYTKSPTSLVPSKEEDENISNAYLYILE
ncbi:uncharacterized protein LOC128182822 isoform X1 [Crassostrea angulata]|uniref:uncharacterized protein LOC128182822 isoform X1 n=1 Tax=Magallana angulata TaxID=2784310 RepID=UPI0022B0C39D|nr:uncharacterized protein LOC128182822 isoform X1 [Crassostrea angulata]